MISAPRLSVHSLLCWHHGAVNSAPNSRGPVTQQSVDGRLMRLCSLSFSRHLFVLTLFWSFGFPAKYKEFKLSFFPPFVSVRQYLGLVEVEESRGMHVCEEAVKKLKIVSIQRALAFPQGPLQLRLHRLH